MWRQRVKRDESGVLRFIPASASRNFGKVVLDARLSASLVRDKSHAGITAARPIPVRKPRVGGSAGPTIPGSRANPRHALSPGLSGSFCARISVTLAKHSGQTT